MLELGVMQMWCPLGNVAESGSRPIGHTGRGRKKKINIGNHPGRTKRARATVKGELWSLRPSFTTEPIWLSHYSHDSWAFTFEFRPAHQKKNLYHWAFTLIEFRPSIKKKPPFKPWTKTFHIEPLPSLSLGQDLTTIESKKNTYHEPSPLSLGLGTGIFGWPLNKNHCAETGVSSKKVGECDGLLFKIVPKMQTKTTVLSFGRPGAILEWAWA